MTVVVVACAVGLLAVVVALLHDEPSADRVREPGWDPLPAPVDVARVEFPLAFPGYDPASVELAFEALNDAYADLLAVAPPAVLERARRRAALRAGRDPDEPPGPAPEPSATAALEGATDDGEALRTEAALGAVGQGRAPAVSRRDA